MKKKFLIFLILMSVNGWAKPANSPDGYCAFCDQEVLASQSFYEDDLVIALYTHKPVFPGHCLVIPKRHSSRFEMTTDEECTQMCALIKKVDLAVRAVFGTSAYLLMQKNGAEVGQSVPHVHFHYIPRKTGEDSTLKFMARMYISNMESPMSPAEMQAIIDKLKQAMQE